MYQKFMMKILGSISFSLVLIGCGKDVVYISNCPTYPKPNQHVLNKIKNLSDKQVNKWMIKQYKLNKKLEACNK